MYSISDTEPSPSGTEGPERGSATAAQQPTSPQTCRGGACRLVQLAGEADTCLAGG